MKRTTARILSISAWLLSATPLFAQTPPDAAPAATQDSGPSSSAAGPSAAALDTPRHDGFYLALNLGAGVRSVFINSSTNFKLDGNGAGLGLLLGGALAPNLVLHGSLYGIGLEDPDVTVGDLSAPSDETSVTLAALGPGVTYYVMPANVYLGGSVLLAQSRFDVAGTELESDWGVGGEVRVGKQFWVGGHTLLGFGAQGMVAKMAVQHSTDTIKLQAVSLYLDCAFR